MPSPSRLKAFLRELLGRDPSSPEEALGALRSPDAGFVKEPAGLGLHNFYSPHYPVVIGGGMRGHGLHNPPEFRLNYGVFVPPEFGDDMIGQMMLRTNVDTLSPLALINLELNRAQRGGGIGADALAPLLALSDPARSFMIHDVKPKASKFWASVGAPRTAPRGAMDSRVLDPLEYMRRRAVEHDAAGGRV